MIKIVTGYSGPGGSTEAHSKLCNLFNDNGYECVMYGPHSYHMSKCKGDLIANLSLSKDDIIISHFRPMFTMRPPVKKYVLSIHEKDLWPLKQNGYEFYDTIHFIRESQKQWHDIEHEHFFCSNVHDELTESENKPVGVAGIIGNIDANKNVHLSIERALKDGMREIYLFGNIHDNNYYETAVEPLIIANPHIVKRPTFVDNKQEMYDMISDVYLSSKSEVAPYIQGEARLTGTKFHGTPEIEADTYKIMSAQEILDTWVEVLEL